MAPPRRGTRTAARAATTRAVPVPGIATAAVAATVGELAGDAARGRRKSDPRSAARSPANGRRATPGPRKKNEPPTISPGSYSHAVQQMNRRQRKLAVLKSSSAATEDSAAGSPVSAPDVAPQPDAAESPVGGVAYNLAQIERRERAAARDKGHKAGGTDGASTPPSPPSRGRHTTDVELGAMLAKCGAEPPARRLWMQNTASVALNSRQSFEMRLKIKEKSEQRRAEILALNRVLARRDAQNFAQCLVVVGGSNVYGQAKTVWQYHPQVGVWRKLCELLESRCNAASCATPRGDLVSCGGYITGGTFVDTVEIYEPRLKASRMLPPMPQGVYGGRACCIGDQLFVVGGQSCEEVRSSPPLVFLSHHVPSAARLAQQSSHLRSGVFVSVGEGHEYAASL